MNFFRTHSVRLLSELLEHAKVCNSLCNIMCLLGELQAACLILTCVLYFSLLTQMSELFGPQPIDLCILLCSNSGIDHPHYWVKI